MKSTREKTEPQKAILLGRVSSKKQEDDDGEGDSRDAQIEEMRDYCRINDIEIAKEIKETRSAKNFVDRPKYKEIMGIINNDPGINLLLTTSHDRFIREQTIGREMIRRLYKRGVEFQNINMPFDRDNYEVEFAEDVILKYAEWERYNISKRTRAGVKYHLLHGRYCLPSPPKGYVYKDFGDVKILVPNEEADFIKKIFMELAKGNMIPSQVYKKYTRLGFKCTWSQFYKLIKNPIYKSVIVYKEKGKETQYIKGVHDEIVSPEVFDEVQKILNGTSKKRKIYTKHNQFFLRGKLICHKCGKLFTSSPSRGNGGRVDYYKCTNCIATNYNLTKTHQGFFNYLMNFQFPPEVIDLYLEIMKSTIKEKNKTKRKMIKNLEAEIEKNRTQIKNMDKKYSEGKLNDENYERVVEMLDKEYHTLISAEQKLGNIEDEFSKYLSAGMTFLQNLTHYFNEANFEQKHKILGSIFTGNINYDGKYFRTNGINEVVKLICNNSKDLEEFEVDKESQKSNVSSLVPTT